MKFIASVFLFIVVLVSCAWAQSLEIHHISVGQGDASLIIRRDVEKLRTLLAPKLTTHVTNIYLMQHVLDSNFNASDLDIASTVVNSVLIDLGTATSHQNIKNYMQKVGVTTPTYIFISHYHDDHIGGAPNLIFSGSTIIDRGRELHLPRTKKSLTRVYKAYASKAYNYKMAKVDTSIYLPAAALSGLDSVQLSCVAANKRVLGVDTMLTNHARNPSENDFSVAWLLKYGQFRYFTGGDLGGLQGGYLDSETPLAKSLGHVCAMKINHHGSQSSSNKIFMDSLRPKSCVISCGYRNKHGHPSKLSLANIGRYVAASNCYNTNRGYNFAYIISDDSIRTKSFFMIIKHLNEKMVSNKKKFVVIDSLICH